MQLCQRDIPGILRYAQDNKQPSDEGSLLGSEAWTCPEPVRARDPYNLYCEGPPELEALDRQAGLLRVAI
jgi:hypothetical protein